MEAAPAPDSEWRQHKTIRARRNIKSSGQRADLVHVICEGWAFRFAQLRDGRRQILSILVPGDVITTTGLFDERVRFSVQALTDARYCGFSRSIVRARLTSDPQLFDAWADLLVISRQQHFGLLIDLGCRSADERIAHLILDLRARLEQRGMAAAQGAFEFPLKQRHIASATGLTPEHVSRVIGSFRKAGLIEIGNGLLEIRDPVGLERIGGLHF